MKYSLKHIWRWLAFTKEPPMKFTQLVSELCARERGVKQVDAAQMSEVLRHLKDLIAENDYITGNRVIECLKKK